MDVKDNLLATGSTDGTCRIWDLRSGKCHTVVQIDHQADGKMRPSSCWPIRCLKFDYGGNWLAIGSGRKVQLWSMCAGTAGISIPTESISQ
eukprot:scaffold652031_cov51-Prasinocladus_malaysianus.AAC.1